MYLYLQNRLISNKLLYVCGGEGYCELLLIVQISYLCNFAIPGTSIAGTRERRPDSGKHLILNHDQAHKLVI